jgi:hypothetical protein
MERMEVCTISSVTNAFSSTTDRLRVLALWDDVLDKLAHLIVVHALHPHQLIVVNSPSGMIEPSSSSDLITEKIPCHLHSPLRLLKFL